MLLMTRQAGDRIRIGDSIVVVVKDVQGGRVQLGIDAPRDVKVRAEDAAGAEHGGPRGDMPRK